jgi:hypothetical protein
VNQHLTLFHQALPLHLLRLKRRDHGHGHGRRLYRASILPQPDRR